MRCAGSPTRRSAAASGANSTSASRSTTCAGSSSSPTAAQPATPRHDDQTTQAHCHSLVVNACVLSTTGYLEDAIAAQRADGRPVSDEAISHLSLGHYEPINPYGTLNFDVANVVKRPRRPLRRL